MTKLQTSDPSSDLRRRGLRLSLHRPLDRTRYRVGGRAALLALAAVALGCTEEDGAGSDASVAQADAAILDDGGVAVPGADARLEVGTGAEAFVPVGDGDIVELGRGCQGAQHLWVSLRTAGMRPERMTVELSLQRVSDGAVATAPLRARLMFDPRADDADQQAAERVGIRLVVDDPDLVVDQEALLTATVTNIDKVTATTTRRTQVQWGDEVCATGH